MEILIDKPYIKKEENKSILSATIKFGEDIKEIFIEVDEEYGKFLVDDIVDAFLVMVLPYAMMKARKEKVLIKSNCPASDKLLLQIKNYFVPIMCKNISYYENIDIDIKGIKFDGYGATAVGTGVSCGVDSSYSIVKNMKNADYPLTHLVLGNIGIYEGYDSVAQLNLEHKASIISESVNLPLINIKSNACIDLYKKAHAPIVPFIFMGLILSLQKLFKIYFYSSAFEPSDFGFKDEDAAYYEIFTVSMLSSDNLTFYSSGAEVSRLEKVEYIATEEWVKKVLSVCLNVMPDGGNCGRCAKCTRTMAELYVLGVLDEFNGIFDVEDFKNNFPYHWGFVLLKAWSGDPFYIELIKRFKEKDGISLSIYFSAIKKWFKRGCTFTNKKREKVEDIL